MPATCSQDIIERIEAATAQLEALALISAIVRINTATGDLELKVGSNWYAVSAFDDGGVINLQIAQTPST